LRHLSGGGETSSMLVKNTCPKGATQETGKFSNLGDVKDPRRYRKTAGRGITVGWSGRGETTAFISGRKEDAEGRSRGKKKKEEREKDASSLFDEGELRGRKRKCLEPKGGTAEPPIRITRRKCGERG